jgi:hypothetical protein
LLFTWGDATCGRLGLGKKHATAVTQPTKVPHCTPHTPAHIALNPATARSYLTYPAPYIKLQVDMPANVAVHAASCGTTFTIVLAKKSPLPPSPPSSAAACAAAPASPGFSLEELTKGSDRKHDQKRIGRCCPKFITGIVF